MFRINTAVPRSWFLCANPVIVASSCGSSSPKLSRFFCDLSHSKNGSTVTVLSKKAGSISMHALLVKHASLRGLLAHDDTKLDQLL